MTNRGFGTVAVVASIAGLAVIGSILFFNMQPKEDIMRHEAEVMMEEGKDMVDEGEEMQKKAEEMLEEAKPEAVAGSEAGTAKAGSEQEEQLTDTNN